MMGYYSQEGNCLSADSGSPAEKPVETERDLMWDDDEVMDENEAWPNFKVA